MNPTTNVSIDYTTDEEYLKTTGGGGIRILLDSTRLNRFVNEEDFESTDEWFPKYVGRYLDANLRTMIEKTIAASKSNEPYEVFSLGFLEYIYQIDIEPIGEEVFRIAFRTRKPAQSDRYTTMTVPESGCGYPVDMYAWGDAVCEAGIAYRDQLADLEQENLANDFDELLSDLAQLL